MIVLHVIIGLNVGGAERMLYRLVTSFDNTNMVNTVVISLTDLGKIGQALQEKKITVYSLGISNVFNIAGGVFRLYNLIKKINPDIVQTWMYHADLIGGLVARFAGKKNIIWGVRRTSAPNLKSATYLIFKLCAFFSRKVPQTIVCVAEAARKTHISYGYDKEKMLVISNGLELANFFKQKHNKLNHRQELGLPLSARIIGCVGRYNFDKGQDLFLTAAIPIAKEYKDVVFVLIGRDCDYANKELSSYIDSSELASRVFLLGERDDIPECLSTLDIFCMPSRTEGFPNGLAEAMAMSLPCVASRVGDVELLTGETAIIVEENNASALAEGIKRMLDFSDKQREILGSSAALRVHSEFSIEKAREQFLTLYKRILAS